MTFQAQYDTSSGQGPRVQQEPIAIIGMGRELLRNLQSVY